MVLYNGGNRCKVVSRSENPGGGGRACSTVMGTISPPPGFEIGLTVWPKTGGLDHGSKFELCPPRKTYPDQDFSYSGAPEQSNQNSLPENGVSFAKFHFFPLFKMNKLPFDERIIKWVDICCNERTSPINGQSHGL